MSNYMYIECSIAIKLPDNIPPEPEDYDEYDKWYEKYIGPTMAKWLSIPELEDVDIHNQEIVKDPAGD